MKITAKTKLLGLFADPADHSKSPAIFNSIFEKYGMDYAYFAFRIPEGAISDAMKVVRCLDMRGVNISMPHKEAVIPCLDEISEEAKFCGAVNTVVNEDGTLKGYNTDIYGAVKAVEALGVDIEGSRITLLGLGGAGKAVLRGIAEKSPKRVNVFVRGIDALSLGKTENAFRAAEALAFVEKTKGLTGVNIEVLDIENLDTLKSTLADTEILINATGIGMGKDEGKSLVPDASYLKNRPAVLDVIYAPEKTRLLEQAEEAGCIFSNGLNMLIYQAERAFKLLIGEEVKIEDIFESIKDKWKRSRDA